MYNQNLKTINPYFSQTWAGVKLYEIRNNDRNFREGQQYILREYEEKLDCYTGRSIFIEILLVMDDSRFLKEGFVSFQFRVLNRVNTIKLNKKLEALKFI